MKPAGTEELMQRTRFCVMGNESAVGTQSSLIGTLFTVHDPMSEIDLRKMIPLLESVKRSVLNYCYLLR
jgi:hypothetical protein